MIESDNEHDWGNYAVAPAYGHGILYPVSKQLLLYMHSGEALHPWQIDVQKGNTKVVLEEKIFGRRAKEDLLLDDGSRGYRIRYTKATGDIAAIGNSLRLPLAKAESESSLTMAEIMYTEYNAVGALRQDFIYAGEQELASIDMWVLKRLFSAESMIKKHFKEYAKERIQQALKQTAPHWHAEVNAQYGAFLNWEQIKKNHKGSRPILELGHIRL